MMLNFLPDRDVWETLKHAPCPIVLYGMGNGADQILDTLREYGRSVSAVFASDGFVRGHSFRGFPVQTYHEICETFPAFWIVLSFAVRDLPTLQRIRGMNREHPVFSPTIPVAGGGLFTREFVRQHESEFDAAFSLLKDEKSRETYLDVLRFKVSGKVEYLFRCMSEKQEVYQEILRLTPKETIVDLGAYDGDTIREFLAACGGQYHRIYALEPDSKNYQKLLRNTASLPNLHPFHLGAWSEKTALSFDRRAGRNSRLKEGGVLVEVDSVDNLIREPVTLLKMDIEGSEAQALEGAKQTILRDRPKLYVCAYHRNEDLFRLPLQIQSYVPDYQFFFRQHPYLPAWESNFYVLPPR